MNPILVPLCVCVCFMGWGVLHARSVLHRVGFMECVSAEWNCHLLTMYIPSYINTLLLYVHITEVLYS